MSGVTKTRQIMQIHLSSWRYFAALTVPPLILNFKLLFSVDCVFLMALFMLTHYYCWRLRLDERLFLLIQSEEDLIEFDVGMAHLWTKKTAYTQPLAERYYGARKLFYRAIFSLLALWGLSLAAVIGRLEFFF